MLTVIKNKKLNMIERPINIPTTIAVIAALSLGASTALWQVIKSDGLLDNIAETRRDREQEELLEERTEEIRRLLAGTSLSKEYAERMITDLACDYVLHEKGYSVRMGAWQKRQICEAVTTEYMFERRAGLKELFDTLDERRSKGTFKRFPGQY